MEAERSQRAPILDPPESNGCVERTGGERLPIRRERHAEHLVGVALHRPNYASVGHAPQLDRLVARSRREDLPIRREGHAADRSLVALERPHALVRGSPETNLAIFRAGGEKLTIARVFGAPDPGGRGEKARRLPER